MCGVIKKKQYFDLNDQNANLRSQEGEHNHDEDVEVIETDKIKNQLRTNIIESPRRSCLVPPFSATVYYLNIQDAWDETWRHEMSY